MRNAESTDFSLEEFKKTGGCVVRWCGAEIDYYKRLNDVYCNFLMSMEYSNNPEIRAITDNRHVSVDGLLERRWPG